MLEQKQRREMKVDKISKLANTFSEGVDAIEVQRDGFSLGEKNIYENSYENPLDLLNSLYSDFKTYKGLLKVTLLLVLQTAINYQKI